MKSGARAPAAPVRIAPDRRRRFSDRLRRWFRRNGRDLPWRRTRDPYAVLVSELMLQQTQVARVIPFYESWLATFPTLADVARAPKRRVMEKWEGLGYYARARNLQKLARHVTANGGELPSDPKSLGALPGIGPYTAGAVASFAFERRAALVDTNVARVLQRAFAPRAGIKTSAGNRKLWAVAEALLPRGGRAAWTHNQALMELGATVCTARVAHCGRCPVRSDCATGRATAGRGIGDQGTTTAG